MFHLFVIFPLAIISGVFQSTPPFAPLLIASLTLLLSIVSPKYEIDFIFDSIFRIFEDVKFAPPPPHSLSKFDHTKHFLRQDLLFHLPGVHLLLKWTKTLQDHKSHHLIQLPELDNLFLCPTRALKALVRSMPLPPTAPLFTNNFPSFSPVIYTHVRDSLKKFLIALGISPSGHGFHTFQKSGATFAFDHNIPLQNIMAHGLWRSSAVWTYLQNSHHSSSIISANFALVWVWVNILQILVLQFLKSFLS